MGTRLGFVFRSRMATDAQYCHESAPPHAKDDADFALPIILQHPALAELSLDFGDERMSPSPTGSAPVDPLRRGLVPRARAFFFTIDRAPFAIHQYYGDRDRSACFAERHFVWSILFSVIMLATALSNPIWPDWLPNILMIAGVLILGVLAGLMVRDQSLERQPRVEEKPGAFVPRSKHRATATPASLR